MIEPFYSNNQQESLVDTGLACSFKSGQSITIPKPIREELSILFGDEVIVSVKANQNELIIQKNSGETVDNKMIVSEKGSIRIPKELKRFLHIKPGDTFKIFLLSNQAIVLRKAKLP
ncbi:AbrB/MazE/SpoVT family DNA-binding domain-containing protein [Alkalihalobacillus oceani]|uniref:AbrB/MazE/SpoVT family DNA-binding domain-containing protein n=1 Tax=Halalkalibacter oceani TaxID=1653776 RepID=A0A9X2DU64_9BACI|nr:AbrB/MazE/SpoVT family DNA-binding domain-containing protein [Halalkalibacter oceani]MCM3715468.1 AbrB/MazE/SpoVT family DNA-binding domain-containing protein [Halalkalibacter oceani]